MPDSIAIKLENVSKKYSIGKEKDGSLRGTLGGLFSKKSASTEDFWALKDVSFDIQKGDVVGIIGKNGAGKSTLLKILSQITKPTEGRIEINGRVASLLEVGTGFHPELTGRENVFLNGTILGMTRKEVAAKFDEIVAFSGVEKFIDTPVKRYSSGMYVRLAFAVAAHLEPEILIIDEVLAVGDAEFQKKCLGKMKDVAGEGRTVIFVSHDLTAVKKLCTRGVLLKSGKVALVGSTNEVISEYQKIVQGNNSYEATSIEKALGNEFIRILHFIVSPLKGSTISISSGINVNLKFYNAKANINLDTTFELRNANETIVFHVGHFITKQQDSKTGFYEVNFEIPQNILNAGNYYFKIIFGENQRYVLFSDDCIASFEIENEAVGATTTIFPGVICPSFDYQVNFSI